MAVLLFESGAFTVKVKYIEPREGIWYFRRRIPHDLRKHYPSREAQIFCSLKTRDVTRAAKLANQMASEQDALWRSLRENAELSGPELKASAAAILQQHGLRPGQYQEYRQHKLEPDEFLDQLRYMSQTDDGSISADDLPDNYRLAADLFYGKTLTPTLSEARDKHFALGKGPKGDKALAQFNNAYNQFLSLAGDLPIDKYRREDANRFVEVLADKKNKPATIKRYIAQIRPVFGTAIREFELNRTNIFEKVSIPEIDDEEDRPPFTVDEIVAIQKRCREVDDQRRWAISILSDTGMRLSEVAGLRREDIVLEDDYPHLIVKAHPKRRLKNAASERVVPLVGEALWAAERVVELTKGPDAFPVFFKDGVLQAGGVSATLNKWLKEQGLAGRQGLVLHSFRHSLRDRLRDAGVPKDVQDRLGGWKSTGVGENYGRGHGLKVLHGWISRAIGSL
jgi:integrase